MDDRVLSREGAGKIFLRGQTGHDSGLWAIRSFWSHSVPLHRNSHGRYVHKRPGCVLIKRSLQKQVAGLQVEVRRRLLQRIILVTVKQQSRWEMREVIKAQLRQRK